MADQRAQQAECDQVADLDLHRRFGASLSDEVWQEVDDAAVGPDGRAEPRRRPRFGQP